MAAQMYICWMTYINWFNQNMPAGTKLSYDGGGAVMLSATLIASWIPLIPIAAVVGFLGDIKYLTLMPTVLAYIKNRAPSNRKVNENGESL